MLKTNTQITILFTLVITALCLPLISSAAVSDDPEVIFDRFPAERQLFPRNLSTNTATVTIEGYETNGGFSDAGLRVMRSGRVYGKYKKRLTYNAAGEAYFEFKIEIDAELANYDFEIYCKKGRWRHVKTARKVVAGDIYVVQGQSNAYAAKYDGSASSEEHIFVRTYGTTSDDPSEVQATNSWEYAHADNLRDLGAVGQWATRVGRLLKDHAGVPIAILNGAEGGKEISYFLRNDAAPDDLTTNYGRLRHRVQGARSGSKIRGILWYQGEADARNGQSTAYYKSKFEALYNDWKSDYRNVEKIYIMQIRTGCFYIANPDLGLNIQEAQRQLANEYDDIEIMTAKGVPQHTDACHNSYESYMRIGDRMTDLLIRDFYGGHNDNVSAPEIAQAQLIDQYTLKLSFKNPNDYLTIEAGALSDFRIEGSSIEVVSGEFNTNNELILYLSGSYSTTGATGLSYLDHASYGYEVGYVRNDAGIGLVSFKNLPVVSCNTLNCLAAIEIPYDFDGDDIGDHADSDDDNDGLTDTEELNCNQGYFTMASNIESRSSSYTSPAFWDAQFSFNYGISQGTITNQTINGEMIYLGYNVPDQYEKAELEITLNNPMDWMYVQLCDIDQSIRESASIQFYNGDMAVAPTSFTFGNKVESLGGQIFRSKSNSNQTTSCSADNRVDFQFNMPIDRIVIKASSTSSGNADMWLRIGSCLYDNDGNNIADYQQESSDNPIISSRSLEATASTATIFPNPVFEELTITATQAIQSIKILDLVGRTVWHEQTNSNREIVSVGQLAKGSYFVELELVDGSYTMERFTKK